MRVFRILQVRNIVDIVVLLIITSHLHSSPLPFLIFSSHLLSSLLFCHCAYIGNVITLESASLTWIMDGEGDTAESATVAEEKPAPEKKRKSNQSEEASASDNFLVTSDDLCDRSSDGNATVGEEQSTKKSPHTLANLNFKVKKGKNRLKQT